MNLAVTSAWLYIHTHIYIYIYTHAMQSHQCLSKYELMASIDDGNTRRPSLHEHLD